MNKKEIKKVHDITPVSRCHGAELYRTNEPSQFGNWRCSQCKKGQFSTIPLPTPTFAPMNTYKIDGKTVNALDPQPENVEERHNEGACDCKRTTAPTPPQPEEIGVWNPDGENPHIVYSQPEKRVGDKCVNCGLSGTIHDLVSGCPKYQPANLVSKSEPTPPHNDEDGLDAIVRDYTSVAFPKVKSSLRERITKLLEEAREEGKKEECDRFLNQKANEHDNQIRAKEQARIKSLIEGIRKREWVDYRQGQQWEYQQVSTKPLDEILKKLEDPSVDEILKKLLDPSV